MINQDFFLALEDLEKEKGISQAEFIAALENALVIAYKKSTGTAGGVEVRLNAEKKSIKIYSTKQIVEEVIDPDLDFPPERKLGVHDHSSSFVPRNLKQTWLRI